MSKVDAMQAMREARYAARSNPKNATAAPRPAPVVRTTSAVGPKVEAASEAIEESEVVDALCGHRSMNNRICRRPAGHSEKNHRYN